jgi:hypothetical protein
MNCKYIHNHLFKSIKEQYFRKYSKMLDVNFNKSNDELNAQLSELSKLDIDYEFNAQLDDFLEDTTTSNLAKQMRDFLILKSRNISCNHPIVDILKAVSNDVYLVGGAVRDCILDETTKDYDFVCDIPYDTLKAILEHKGYTVKSTGEQFLVLIASDGIEQFEIANFRKDSTYSDGRRPDSVSIGTMKDDSERRDFTCNSLYYNLHTELIEDPTGLGIDDCNNRTLRFNGKAEDRLKEDALRGWRAFRLCTTKGLKMESKTEKAVRGNFEMIYNNSNPARVLQEMMKYRIRFSRLLST